MEKHDSEPHSSNDTLKSEEDGLHNHNVQPDLEIQTNPYETVPVQPNSNSRTVAYLILYFVMNISLTLYNKTILGSFPFPWVLTALHAGLAALGSYIMLLLGYFELTTLSTRQHLVLFMFSLLFTLNIAMSNVSLKIVSIPFHQVMRATTPIFTIIIYRVFFSRKYAMSVYASITPVILGVGLATIGDYYFSTLGFTLTLTGVMLAAIKGVVTNQIMTGRLRLGVFEVLLRMGPLATVQSLLYSMLSGEFSKFAAHIQSGGLSNNSLLAVMGNGVLAFALNVVSFQTNKIAGALSITICGNLKQCLTIILGALLWEVPISLVNGCGILLAVAGAAWYSLLQLKK